MSIPNVDFDKNVESSHESLKFVVFFPRLDEKCREVMSEVLLATPATSAPQSALFVAWGQLVSFDIFRNSDNTSEPYDQPCSDGTDMLFDVWCPEGAASGDIPFYRYIVGKPFSLRDTAQDTLVRTRHKY